MCLASGLAVIVSSARGDTPPPDRPPSPAHAIQTEELVAAAPRGDLLLVRGAEGTAEYGQLFEEWADLWEAAAKRGRLQTHCVGTLSGDSESDASKAELEAALAMLAAEPQRPLWIVFIGHGTFDGRTAKFNLTGEDVSADDLAQCLASMSRPIAVLQCASASGPFLEKLSGPDRIVVTATKSGEEANFARFGGFLAAAAGDPDADLDKDLQVSLLEAFLRAARQTEEFYSGANRLATEHAVMDDNGDARGSRASDFAGVRPLRQANSAATPDGYTAQQWILVPSLSELELPPERRARRDELEIAVLQLRERKSELSADAYYAELVRLLVELAKVSLGRK
jgi:hypothetical protein